MGCMLGWLLAWPHILEPEILIVDEVFAVGDVEFQKKALGKMKDVSINYGRTVLFVSHQMGPIAQLCDKGLLLNQGETVLFDNIGSVINKYLDMGQSSHLSKYISKEIDRNKEAFIHSMDIVNLNGENLDLLGTNDKIIIDIKIRIQRWYSELELGLSLQDRHGKRIFTIHQPLKEIISKDDVERIIQIEFPSNLVVPGRYSWIAALHLPVSETFDAQYGICNFSVIDSGTQFSKYENEDYGYVFVNNYTVKVK